VSANGIDPALFVDGVNAFVLENATVRGRDWYKLLDAPVLTLNEVTDTKPQTITDRFSKRD